METVTMLVWTPPLRNDKLLTDSNRLWDGAIAPKSHPRSDRVGYAPVKLIDRG
ncbi:MAG: hypothetical protein GDA43_10810 [Hormoscilla sp. SP5CHS1]|nr:hypothetical protein [Hormoscilla sp. SP12CHS1]MBC6453639.1 hypothetical protein [Hormoscilla sp. SP5CHS1]